MKKFLMVLFLISGVFGSTQAMNEATDNVFKKVLLYGHTCKYSDVKKAMENKDVKFDAVNDEGKSFLHIIAEANTNSCVATIALGLFEHAEKRNIVLDINLKDKSGGTPLYYAARNKAYQFAFINYLLSRGAIIDLLTAKWLMSHEDWKNKYAGYQNKIMMPRISENHTILLPS